MYERRTGIPTDETVTRYDYVFATPVNGYIGSSRVIFRSDSFVYCIKQMQSGLYLGQPAEVEVGVGMRVGGVVTGFRAPEQAGGIEIVQFTPTSEQQLEFATFYAPGRIRPLYRGGADDRLHVKKWEYANGEMRGLVLPFQRGEYMEDLIFAIHQSGAQTGFARVGQRVRIRGNSFGFGVVTSIKIGEDENPIISVTVYNGDRVVSKEYSISDLESTNPGQV